MTPPISNTSRKRSSQPLNRHLACWLFTTGEDDETVQVITELARARPWLDLIPNTAEPGRSHALKAGFQAAGRGPVVRYVGRWIG